MEILRDLQGMGKTIFISSHILSELAELCDSVTIIDQGKIRYSGSMRQLLAHDGLQPVYRLTVSLDSPDCQESLAGVPGVVDCQKPDGKLDYILTIDPEQTSSSTLLRSILDLGVQIEAFNRAEKHLNQAFMDLTERGIH